ncbi:MAG: Crp/Fnr family transcriptional regulator [Roseovarius sp.]
MLKTLSIFEQILRRDQRTVARGTILRAEGDESPARFHVMEGWLAVSKSLQDGEQQILEFILPGETYDPTAADGRTSFVELKALCDAAVVAIDRKVWARLLRDTPELWDAEVVRDVAAQARQSERMLRLGKSSAETRIAYVLIEFCLRLSGGHMGRDCGFHVPLGQQQLGDFIGLSSVHVCRTLRRLARQGIITTGDHMDITIHDVAALADLAGVEIAALRAEIIPGAA